MLVLMDIQSYRQQSFVTSSRITWVKKKTKTKTNQARQTQDENVRVTTCEWYHFSWNYLLEFATAITTEMFDACSFDEKNQWIFQL